MRTFNADVNQSYFDVWGERVVINATASQHIYTKISHNLAFHATQVSQSKTVIKNAVYRNNKIPHASKKRPEYRYYDTGSTIYLTHMSSKSRMKYAF